MSSRPLNFNAGPAMLPQRVMAEAARALVDTDGTGLSVLEWSHRSSDYARVHAEASERFLRLLGPGSRDFTVLFLQGGASQQFALVPLNFATDDEPGTYVLTGAWSKKALEEARRLGRGHLAWSGEERRFTSIPDPAEVSVPQGAAYLHLTTNNTIFGTQWKDLPPRPGVPVVADMSSDIFSRPLDCSKLDVIYAGAQKNLGPAGLAVVAVRTELLERVPDDLPRIFSYAAHAKAGGLYHTPPTFAVWLMGRVLAWIEEQGGLEAMERRNAAKVAALYGAIDASGFYRGTASEDSRSFMNATFRLPSEELEQAFLEQAGKERFVGLKGHRSVGGLRVSLYNAVPQEAVDALVAFMQEFERTHG